MLIQIESAEEHMVNGSSRYFYVTASTEKHRVFVSLGPYEVRVVVMNSAHKTWRGSGKGFASVDAAVANYKTAEIRELIKTAAELSKGGAQ